MAKVRVLRDGITRENYFQEFSTGMSFRRITGALVWPHEALAGCIVVLGETRSRRNILGNRRHDAHKLHEFESLDTAELVDALAFLTGDWLVRVWATPLCDKRAWLLEDAVAEQRRLRRRTWRYADPQGWSGKGEGLLPFYHSLAQRRTMSEKTLFLGAGSRCADELDKMVFADGARSLLEFPAAAALCFALAEIDLNPRRDWGERSGFDGGGFGPADDLGGY